MKVIWTHPNKGVMTETLCFDHTEIVTSALATLGIGYDGDQTTGVCLRCQFDGYSITTWMPQWAIKEI